MTNLPAIAANLPGLYIAAFAGITLILWSMVFIAVAGAQSGKRGQWTVAIMAGFLSYFPLSIVLARFGAL